MMSDGMVYRGFAQRFPAIRGTGNFFIIGHYARASARQQVDMALLYVAAESNHFVAAQFKKLHQIVDQQNVQLIEDIA